MDRANLFLRWGVTILILLVGLYVALSPSLVYAPVPKVILFCLVSFLPAILFGAEASSQFKLGLPGFVFATTGAAAANASTPRAMAVPRQRMMRFDRIVDSSARGRR